MVWFLKKSASHDDRVLEEEAADDDEVAQSPRRPKRKRLTMFASWYAPGEYLKKLPKTSVEAGSSVAIGNASDESSDSTGTGENGTSNSNAKPYYFTDSKRRSMRISSARQNVVKFATQIERYLYVTCWLLLLAFGLILSKVWCLCGLPKDCTTEFATPPAMEDLQSLFIYGLVMSWMCGISVQPRFWRLFSAGRWWFFVVFFLSSPIYSAILGEDTWKHYTQISFTCCETRTIIIITVISVLGFINVAWHLYFAFSRHRMDEAIVYTISRFIFAGFYMLGFLFAKFGVLHKSAVIEPYIVPFTLSLFCQFDHWFSILLLAIFTGIFVQSLSLSDLSSGLFEHVENCQVMEAVKAGSIYTSILSSDKSTFSISACMVNKDGSPNLIDPENLIVVVDY